MCLGEVVDIYAWSERLGNQCLGGGLQLLEGEWEVCKDMGTVIKNVLTH